MSVNVPTGGGGSTPQEGFTDKTLTAASNTISFTGLSGEPTAFIVMAEADVATGASPYKVASVAFDGTSVFGQIITNTSNANVTFDDSSFSKSYSNGTLTITSTGPQFQEGMYSLLYIYGGSSGNIQTAEVQVGSGATSITFSDLPGASDSWKGTYFLVFQSNFGTSNGYQRVLCVERIGGDLYGLEMDSAAHFSDAHWSESLSNGSLTVSSDGTNAGGYFHQPGYYKLVYVLNEAPEIEIESLTVTQNGTYSESGKAYSPVIVNVAGGGSATVDTKTVNNSDATATSLSFTGLSGQPKAFFVRCTSNLSRSSSNRYYYIADIRWDGSSSGGVAGNKFYVYNGQFSNQTSGYSFTYSNGTLTLSTTGSQSASPGSFFNGTYELVYVY